MCGGNLFKRHRESAVWRCGNCGFTFRNPAPPASQPEGITTTTHLDGFVAALARRTPPGDTVTLEVPHIRPWSRLPAADLVGFTPLSLTMLLERHGLRVVRRRPSLRPIIRVTVRRSI